MTQKMTHLVSVPLLAVLLVALAPAAGAQALQPRSITVINVRRGVVSAKVNTSGEAFHPLRPGQSVTFHDSKKHLATSTIDVEVIIDMQHMINVSNPNNDISRKTLGPH